MKLLCKILILILIASHCWAGFGRGGSSGSFRSSGFSSRSYSAPRSYSSYSAPRYSAPRTVVREYHTNTVQAPSSSGVHPLVAGMAGYMVGDALNRNHGTAQAAQPQVMYVNGQPQQSAQPNVQDVQQPVQNDAHNEQIAQAPVQTEQHGLFFWFAVIVFSCACVVLVKKSI